VSDHLDGLELDPINRRELLKRAGVVGAGLAVSGSLAETARAAGSHFDASSHLEAAPTTLRWAFVGDAPSSLDISTNYTGLVNTVGQLVNEPLLMLDPNGKLIPWLATSWSNPSPLRYVYKIRKGVKFSDGSPFTVQDAAYSLGRNLDKTLGSQISSFYTNVKSVRVTGPDEVTVFLKKPDISVASTLPVLTLMVKESYVKPLGKNYARPGTKMLGTGPFLLNTYNASTTSFDINPHYWGRRPPVQHVQFSYLKDTQTLELAIRNGSIDGTFSLASTDVPAYKKMSGVQVNGTLGLVYFLTFDTSTAPFNDVHARRAIAHCWNGAGFVKGPIHGLGEVATGMVFPWQWSSVQSTAQTKAFYARQPKYPFSIAAAKAELAKSSSPNGFSLSTEYPTGYENLGLGLQTLAANLQQIGIKLSIKEVPVNDWLNKLYGHTGLELFTIIFGADYVDPNDFLDVLLNSINAKPNAFNTANYKNPTVDKLLQREKSTTNVGVRRDALRTIYTTLNTDLPYFGLWYEDLLMAIRKPFTYTGFSAMYYYTPWIYHIKV
jgi:peptide/nickel transport system substrate-binding protein